MNSRDAIQQELNDLRSSLPFSNNEQPVFTVPEGYFEDFAASVLAKLKTQQEPSAADELKALSPVLAAIPKQTPFSVPENYFTHLATGLPALVNDDEALPEFLQSHTKQMPYAVPTGYFEELTAQVAAKVAKPKAKVVPLSVRFMRYAIAASIIGVLVLGGFLYFGGNSSSIDPVQHPADWVAQKLKNVSNRDLEAFLQNLDVDSNSKELAQKGGKPEVRSLLHDVSTTELDAFLKELPTDTDLSDFN